MRRGLAGLAVLVAFVPAPAETATLYGLVDTGELYVSSDGGVTWTVRSTLPVRNAIGLLRGSAAAELYLVSESGSVYLSNDGGVSWNAVGAVAASDVVAVDYVLGAAAPLIVLTASGTLWGSADAGVSFPAIGSMNAPDLVSLTPNEGGSLFALTRTGTVLESVDDGASWIVKGTLPISDGTEIETFGTDLAVLTAAGDVWTSTEGDVWTAVGSLSQVHMTAMIRGASGGLIAATREGEVATSSDGTSWTWVGTINQLNVVALGSDAPPTGVPEPIPYAAATFPSAPRPNPRRGAVNSSLVIQLPGPDIVHISLFDVHGRRIATRAPEALDSGGVHVMRWDPGLLPSGLYFVQMTTGRGLSASTRWTFMR